MAADFDQTVHCKGPEGQAATVLVEDIIQRWRDGAPARAEEALARHPELAVQPDAALRLIYEEVCLRRERGEDISTEEVGQRFPAFRAQLELLFRCHSLLEPVAVPPSWPVVGETLGEYELLLELGRGAQGRVFLATQPGLGDRSVVLKLTPWSGEEHLTLARVQHTYIVPLYAVHDDPRRNLRAICMPCYGGAPLHALLAGLRNIPPAQRTGQQLLDELDRRQIPGAPPLASRVPFRQQLARDSYVTAVCRLGVCLAQALQYAHERGLLHLDIKPSNVLLTAEGEPMLLDFHLARPPLAAGDPPPEWFGGTPGYMSPEQQAAVGAANDQLPVPQAVDARSDVYALGLLLYEALDNAAPPPNPAAIVRLRRRNPALSPGLVDILRKCLASDPADRYQDAAAVVIDLQRHLNHLPLKGAPNRSLRERWRKWRRRSPSALLLALLGLSVLSAVIGYGAYMWQGLRQKQEDADKALIEGQKRYKAGEYALAIKTLGDGIAAAEELPWGQPLRAELERELRVVRRAEDARQLHTLADRVRSLYGATMPAEQVKALQPLWRKFWDQRERLLDGLEPDSEDPVYTDLLDLGLIWADLCAQAPGPAGEGRHEALQILEQVEEFFPKGSPVLYRQRQEIARALGMGELAEEAGLKAAASQPTSPWDYYALGRRLLQAGDLEHAAELLQRAVDKQPQGFWPNWYHGLCAHRRDKYGDAIAAFSVCIALAPNDAQAYYNRALAMTAWNRKPRAVRDYGEALRLDPTMAAAALNRGLLRLDQGRPGDAVADLELALKLGSDPAATHYALARAHLARHDEAAAIVSVRRALAANPRHAHARQLLEQLSSGSSK